nr:ribonuclease [Curvibacter sp. HBC28]
MLQNVAARTSRFSVACLMMAAALFGTALVHSREAPATDGLPTVTLAELPVQGRETYQLILQGGPFPYDKDGVVFGNRERILPSHKRGYYREYTVRTPGSRDRGARRLVCGGLQPTAPQACYYSNDHYASFRRLVE